MRVHAVAKAPQELVLGIDVPISLKTVTVGGRQFQLVLPDIDKGEWLVVEQHCVHRPLAAPATALLPPPAHCRLLLSMLAVMELYIAAGQLDRVRRGLDTASCCLPRFARMLAAMRSYEHKNTNFKLLQDPYWCDLWPSGIFMAEELLARPELVRGQRVCEIGCGLGLAGLAAAAAGEPRGGWRRPNKLRRPHTAADNPVRGALRGRMSACLPRSPLPSSLPECTRRMLLLQALGRWCCWTGSRSRCSAPSSTRSSMESPSPWPLEAPCSPPRCTAWRSSWACWRELG